MKRTQVYLGDDQDRRLAERAQRLGTTKSDVIRRAVDDLLEREDDEAVALARFKKTVEELYESPPSDLPSGSEYVEEIRRAGAEKLDWLERYWRDDEPRP